MAFWPGGWRWLDWSRVIRLRVPLVVRRMLWCGKRRWYIRKGIDMRFPPSLSVNNRVQVSDGAYVAATLNASRFSPFSIDVSVIGPWLSASFDNPEFQTGAPIMRLTMVGNPSQRIRTVVDDTHGSLLRLGDGAAGQAWEVVSKMEWVPDGETVPAWVLCFCRPGSVGVAIGGNACGSSAVGSLDTVFQMVAPATMESHVHFPDLAPGVYTVGWSIETFGGALPAFTVYKGGCAVMADAVPGPSGTSVITIGAGEVLRINMNGIPNAALAYVRVTGPT